MSSEENGCVRFPVPSTWFKLIQGIDGVELIIIIIGTFGQAVAGEAHAVNIFAVIILWSFIVSPEYTSLGDNDDESA